MKSGMTKRGLMFVGIALVLGMFGGPAVANDMTCVDGRRGGVCFGGGPTQNGGFGFGVMGGYSGVGGFSFGGFGHPGGPGCGTHACGSTGTYHGFDFGLWGPIGGDPVTGGVSGSHGPWCTICYQEYHVSGGSIGEAADRLCYEPTRQPPLYRC